MVVRRQRGSVGKVGRAAAGTRESIRATPQLSPELDSVVPRGAVPPFDAVVFDLDGVVTDTVRLHALAWKELFDVVLTDRRAGLARPVEPFDPEADYRRFLAGRAREDGVAAFLAARGVDVPAGREGDGPGSWTVHGLAARKNEIYLARLAEHGIRVFAGTVDLVRRLRAGGVPVGLATASRNAEALLRSAQLRELFDVVVDGTTTKVMGLPGKPDPALFLEVLRRLCVPAPRAAVVEDAAVGVEAGRRAGFGLVVGIARSGDRAVLEAAGADVVLDDVSQLDLGVVRADPWVLTYEGFDPAHEGHREALTALGNGYLGTRGAVPERSADAVHYPGTYLAGVYNRLSSNLQGRVVEDEHLVNAPNWLPLDVCIDGRWWSGDELAVSAERRELDLRRGVLTSRVRLTDSAGRSVRVTQRRLVSMDRPHLACLQTTLVAEGWTAAARVRTGVDAGVTNTNVAEYAALANRHLRGDTARLADPDTIVVEAETSQSRIRIATAARTTFAGAAVRKAGGIRSERGRHSRCFDLELPDGQPVVIDKTVAIVTSRDQAIASPALGALTELATAGGFDDLLPAHEAAWRRLWERFGIGLDGDREAQLVLNLHVFHLLQAISPHTAELDAGVTARGLHGEGYRGHVFWDELFIQPVLSTHLPSLTRALLDYRWRRLPAARRRARQAGLAGARFPWQSGSDGREETPEQLFNLRSGRWMPDNSRRQLHVNFAIAHNAWQQYQTTGDVAWLAERGADLLIEVARLFTSLAIHDPADKRFHIHGVMGPDEYHDGYPDAPGAGLRDNAYTNVLTAWVCQRATETLRLLRGHDCDELIERLGIHPDEPAQWIRLSRRLAVPFHDDGLISQFAGYDHLEELDWDHYRATYGNIGRLDLILEAEGDTTNRYKLAKQSDVVMLVYLLGPEQLLALLARLGYRADPQSLRRTVDYYLARTSHGSTLSRVVHASVLSGMDPARSWDIFRAALAADLDDTQGGTTQEGIHLGAMAGTIDIVTRSFAGMRIEADGLSFTPRLPHKLRHATFQVQYRGQRIDVWLDHTHLRLTARPCRVASRVRVDIGGMSTTIGPGETTEFPLSADGE
jgi:beta-phosphoglucomutase family hydrolase